ANGTNSTLSVSTINLHYKFTDANNNVTEGDQQINASAAWQPVKLGFRAPSAGRLELTSSLVSGSEAGFDDVAYEQTGGMIVQEQHTYAYGAPLTGLNYVIGTKKYRHGYQGQFAEKDEETGTDDFELRMYDSRIGRWTAPDPAGQFHSPYVGMGNNPVSGVDPDGGFSPFAAMAIGAGIGAIGGGIYSKNNGGDFLSGALGGAAVGAIAGGFAWAGLRNVNINIDFSVIGSTLGQMGLSGAHSAAAAYSGPGQGPGKPSNVAISDATSRPLNKYPNIPSATIRPTPAPGTPLPWLGPTLIGLGQPLKFLKPVGALGSEPGSSLASWSLSKVFTGRMATQTLGTRVVGRALGRAVPYVGVMWTTFDVMIYLGDNVEPFKALRKQNVDNTYRSDGSWNTEWHVR
ncbi:MAG: hypothetical protein M3R72_05270, partial [Bacteroidota bacterium]|nr:hypothetical protein [Bacteroidota bacterium]